MPAPDSVPTSEVPSTSQGPRNARGDWPAGEPSLPPVTSARFLLSVGIVLSVTVAAAYIANGQIVQWAMRHHMRTAQLNLSAAMGGLFAGGLAALVAILIVTGLGRSRARQ